MSYRSPWLHPPWIREVCGAGNPGPAFWEHAQEEGWCQKSGPIKSRSCEGPTVGKLGGLGGWRGTLALAADHEETTDTKEGEGAGGGDGGPHGGPFLEAVVGGGVGAESRVKVEVVRRGSAGEAADGDVHAQVARAGAVGQGRVEHDPVVPARVQVVAERAEGGDVGGVLAGDGGGVDLHGVEGDVVVVTALDLVEVQEELEVGHAIDDAGAGFGNA